MKDAATHDSAPADASSVDRVTLRGQTFEAFYRDHYRGLVAVALALSGSRTAAEDITQDSLLVAYRDWEMVSTLDNPLAWVRRVLINRATSAYRSRRSELRALLRLGQRPTPLPAMPEPDEQLWMLVRGLPKRQAQCIALRYVLDCSLEDIAATLGCAEGTVKAHLHQARQRLGRELAERSDDA